MLLVMAMVWIEELDTTGLALPALFRAVFLEVAEFPIATGVPEVFVVAHPG